MGTDSTEDVESDSNINPKLFLAAYDQWAPLPVSGFRPSARYKHAAEVAHDKLYVIGGSRNGRHLSDIQVFDLRTLTWTVVKPHMDPDRHKLLDVSSQEVLPASSGHSLVKWDNKLLIVAGHLREPSDVVTVRSVDLETHHCHVVETSGKIPMARGGQSVTEFGSKLIMFGGECTDRKLLNDLHILNLESMVWEAVETMQTPPAPRFDHTATVHAERYLLIFGGSSHSTCFNDLHVLDLQTMEWSQPQIQGEEVTARAGHAGATMGENWYIVGGGDNKSGAFETLVLDMSKLVMSVVTTVKGRDPLASEGLSLCSTTLDGQNVLVAFGGYNGNYNNEVFVLKPKPSDSLQRKIFQSPAAAAAAASVSAAYALATTAAKDLEFVNGNSSLDVILANSDALRKEKETLGSKLAEVRTRNSKFKEDLDEMNSTHAELSKELLSVQTQLAAERSRSFTLEVQTSELRNRLESLDSIEQELQVLRHQQSASEQELAGAASRYNQRSGVWQWIAGGNRSPEND